MGLYHKFTADFEHFFQNCYEKKLSLNVLHLYFVLKKWASKNKRAYINGKNITNELVKYFTCTVKLLHKT